MFSNTGLPRSGPGVPFIRAQERLDPAMVKDTLGVDWRATLDADDRIVPERIAEFVESGRALYFLSWRLYAQEIEELTPSKIVPGWCRTTLSAEALAAYDAPYPTQEFAAGAHRFPMLVPITIDDTERLKGDAAWEVLGGFDRPVLAIWGAQCPFTHAEGGKQFREGIPGARLPGIEHRALGLTSQVPAVVEVAVPGKTPDPYPGIRFRSRPYRLRPPTARSLCRHAPASGLASTVAPSGQVPDLAFNVRTRRPGTRPATAGRSARACLAASRRLLLYGTFLVAVLFTAIDGYEVSVHTAADARGNVAVSLTVRRDDVPVTDLEPYLGASGHLVGIHAGDLAYAHVHPKH